MCRRTLRILLVIVNILYFTIGAPQNGSAATARSTTATAEARYHPFFPKSSGKGLQGVLHVQNAGTADANFQVDFYTEQGAVVKRYYGTVKPGAAHTLAAEAWAELPVGVYGVRVTSSNGQPLVTVVRVKETNRTVPGLGFDPGVNQSRLATTFHGGPIYGGAKASTIHLFNPTPAIVNGEIILRTSTGTASAPRAWSLPAYGRTSIAFDNQPADFVGTVQITAPTVIAALLQQSNVNDDLELQAFNTPAQQHFLPRVFKRFSQVDSGDYTTKLFISNPTANATSFSITLSSDGNQPTTIPSSTLNPNNATIIDLRDLPEVTAGVYGTIVASTTPVIVSEITDIDSTAASASAVYADQGFIGAFQLFFPRVVWTDHSYSVLNLQNNTGVSAVFTITALNPDGTQNGVPYSAQIPANSATKRILLDNVADGFIGAVVLSSNHPLIGWMDEYVRNGGEPEPAPQPIEPPAPVASFSVDKRAGMVPLEVQFVNTSEGEYTSSQWDFGDGQSSSETNPTHTYTTTGSYTVTLTVLGLGGSDMAIQGSYIHARAAQTPTANFSTGRRSGLAPLTIQFANTTTGDYTNNHWDFGDGANSNETNPTHTYSQLGVYTVTLTVDGPIGSHTTTKGAYVTVRSTPATHPDGWDLDFGTEGAADSGCREWPTYPGVGKVQVTPDNTILMYTYCPSGLTLLHFGMDGVLDHSFGVQGRTVTNGSESVKGMPTIQSDGKIIIISNAGLITRYAANGILDTTFALSATTPSEIAYPTQLLLQPDDQIVISAYSGISRFTRGGALDNSLAGAGYMLTDQILPKPNSEAEQSLLDVAVQTDSKLLLAIMTSWKENAFTQTQHRFVILRLNRDGSLDHTFADLGQYVVFETTNNVSEYHYNRYRDYIYVQPNGYFLLADPVNSRLLRLQPNGALDSDFQEPRIDDVRQLLIDQHGAIIAQSSNTIQRFSTTGLPDVNFGQNGQLMLDSTLFGMTISQDGSLVITIYDEYSYKVLRNVKTMSPPTAPAAKPLTLLYAVLDNNLGDGWTRLVNNIEAGVRSGMTVRLLIDGPTDNDVYLYDVQPDTNPFCPSPANPTCNGRYAEGLNFWRVANENSAHPDSLYQFLVDAMNAYPTADKINLSLIGHGSGWSANVLPGQPSIWRDQNDTVGGMLWDDHPATGQQDSRSLSTKALGQALTWAGEQTGRKIDLLYLDGCSMGMAEVAYEVRNGARYLLASPNIDWASFNYNALLPEVVNANGRTLGERWLQIEAAEFRANPGHPFTLALLDLNQMGGVATAASTLADSLRALVPTQQAQLLAAFAATDRFDSDYDGDLDTLDAYSDLPAFVGQVKQSFPTATAVQQAAESLRTALDAAVVAKDAAGGSPWLFGEQLWQWRNYGGLGIYLPLGQDEARRRLFYHANNLAWTADTTWDEFLAAFWGGNSHAAITQNEMPVCHATTQGCQGLANPLPVQVTTTKLVFLPLVIRSR